MKIKVDKNITLQKVRLKSAEDIYACIDQSRDTLREWLPFVDHTKSKDDVEKYIKSTLYKRGDKKELVFEVLVNKKVVGLLGMKDIDMLNKKAEIGYWLGKDAVGKGIMTRSLIALLTYAFNEMKINRIQIKCAVENIRSCNIPKQLGFAYEGLERQGEFLYGRYLDLKIYSLLRKEWIKKEVTKVS